jgi:hypothetical protein
MTLLEIGIVYLGAQWVIYFCEAINLQGGLSRSVATSTTRAVCGYHELVLGGAVVEQEGGGHGLAVVYIS